MADRMGRAYSASLDPSTGLYDCQTIRLRLAEEISRARRYRYPVSLVMVTFSATESDHAEERVRQLAELLEWHVRAADILARCGDEALLLLLPHTGECGARQLGERVYHLATVMQLPAGLGGKPAPVHIGITTLLPDYAGDSSAVVDTLRERLYSTKGSRQTPCALVSLD